MATQTPSTPPPVVSAPVVSVAFDVGPLQSRRTGVGNAVGWTLDSLAAQPSIAVHGYMTSMRARRASGVRRLPLPAAVAQRWWQHWSPPLDRLLGHPDVVHGTNYVVPPARCARLVSVYDCWFLDNPDDAAPDVRRAGEVLRRSVADGAMVVASSNATAARVRELLDTDRVSTILLGPPRAPVFVDAHAQPSVAKLDRHPFVLALGTNERRKNIPTLIAAFARVAHEHPEARLVVAGAPGDDTEGVARAMHKLDRDAADRVTMLGPVDEVTKAWLLEHAHVLAYPSLDEGFGFPILEAARAGTAVVASTAGSIPEIAGNAALLSPPTDIDSLAANIFWLLDNDEMRAKLVKRGLRNLERFSWDRTATALAGLYVDLANGTAP